MDTELYRPRPQVAEKKENEKTDKFEQETKVKLETLSELTGFPLDFIKKELLVKGDSLSMNELRESVLGYLSKSDEGYSHFN